MESKYLPAQDLIIDVARYLEKEIVQAIDRKGFCALGLSGGQSPKELYELLAKKLDEKIIRKLVIFLVDERYLPFENPESNFKLVKEHFIAHLVCSPKQFIHPLTFLPIEEAAVQYEKDLKKHYPFDLLLLGVGEDGHTASLFKGEEYLCKDARMIIASDQIHGGFRRLSVSYKAILESRKALFFAPGKNKEEILKAIIKPGDEYPAQRIALRHSNIILFREKF